MRRLCFLLAVLIPIWFAPPAQASAVAHLRVGHRVVTWTSRETYRPKDVIAFRVRTRREKLTFEQVDPYVLRFYGAGLVVKVVTPRHGRGHIRLRAIGIEESPRTVAVRFWIER